MPVYGSGIKLIVGGTNGSNVGTDAEEGFALKPDFSERATWLYLTVSAATPTLLPLPLTPTPYPYPLPLLYPLCLTSLLSLTLPLTLTLALNPQWTTACFFLLSFVFHLGNALLWRKPYLRLLASG